VSALNFYSMPTFVLGFLLIWVFAYKINPFPFQGYVPITQNPYQWFMHLVLPWLTLALVTAATYTRLARGSMLDVSGEDYIRTARAKGMRERRVIFRHELRASLTPLTTQAGLDIGTALGGAIITETLFGIPGLGWTAVRAITNQDLPVIMGITMLAATFVVVANLVVDILYTVLDPRVRL
jgi:peptide/nickel transport system permease protein